MPKHLVPELTNQAIGGQSVLYKVFRQALSCLDTDLRRLEITYFSLSVLGFALLLVRTDEDKEDLLDDLSLAVLKRSLPSANESISMANAIAEYQNRFLEYNQMLGTLLESKSAERPNPYVTILMHAYQSVTGRSARGQMIKISASAAIMEQFIMDQISFVQSLNEP